MWERAMRAGIVAGGVALALLVSGCDTNDSRYFRYGIGTNLYSEDIAQTTQYQDIYLTELCRQTLSLTSTTAGQCVNTQLSPNDWNLLVQAGLNDVDRRCDSYLAWLDDRRRTNTAVLKELGDLAVASQAIMRVSGVSANPITLAGLAFGLAADTFININSRLLLEIDKTTVQTLVLRRRNEYRGGLQTVRIENRPAAIHALRSYLNICTPFTIETDINATITVFQQVGAGGLDNKGPLVTPKTIPPQRADKPIVVTSLPPKLPGALTPLEEKLTLAQARAIQRILCVSDTGNFGPLDSLTRSSLIDFMAAQGTASTGKIETFGDLTALTAAQNVIRSCAIEKLESGFESGLFAKIGKKIVYDQIARAIDRVNRRISTKIAPLADNPDATMGDTIRGAITALRTAYATEGLPITAGSSINAAVWKQLIKDGRVQ
jgi:hypothetical protein